MKRELTEKVRAALNGWVAGDTAPLEELLHPDVELLWWKTGEWDIHGREKVLGLLRQRASQRASGVSIDVAEVAEDALIVTRAAPPGEGPLPATLITFKDDMIVKLHQFRSADEAQKAAPWRTRT
jgi:hypothetical protein